MADANNRILLDWDALEMLGRAFGAGMFNHTGSVDLRFLRPVRPGDTIAFSGRVTGISRETNGSKISVEIKAEIQRGDTTAWETVAPSYPTSIYPPKNS